MVTDPDPFYDWLERNPEVAALHSGKRCAFHPEHGLLAVGRSLEEVFDVLGEKSKLNGLMLGVFPSDVPWVPYVTDPQKKRMAEVGGVLAQVVLLDRHGEGKRRRSAQSARATRTENDMSNRILKTQTIQPELAYVAEGIREGKSRFQLVDQPGLQKTTLAVGCPSVVQLPGGFLIALGLSRDQVEFLRDQCDEILRGSGPKE